MIIECQTCHARFRLDDSRIKGRGARVKCRKCGDSIVVLKDGAPPPPTAPGGEGFFDLGSAVRDSVGERPGSLPPAGNLIPFPAPTRPVEPFSAESPSAGVEAAGPAKDEVDLAFDRVLFPATEGSIPSIREPEASVPESDAPVDPEPRPELVLGALNLDLVPEEKLDLPPAGELDLPPAGEPEPPLGEPPAVEPP
ncbi:MAG TPA: zinc-ribbon domain-containing protein, partial [Candidatus Binatia bacterium]|nr:zinc-ribbon domain-containing protein [Candidatus Binatia bacterium]